MGTPLYYSHSHSHSHSRSEGRKESSLACCCCLTFYYLWPGGIQPPFFPVVPSFSWLPRIRPDRIVHVGMPSSSLLGSAVSPSSVNRGRKGGRQGGTERGATTSDPIQSHVCQIFAMGRLPPSLFTSSICITRLQEFAEPQVAGVHFSGVAPCAMYQKCPLNFS